MQTELLVELYDVARLMRTRFDRWARDYGLTRAQGIILARLFAPAAFVETFNTVGSWACMPFGRSARLVRWQIFATAVMATSFLVGARWGVLG